MTTHHQQRLSVVMTITNMFVSHDNRQSATTLTDVSCHSCVDNSIPAEHHRRWQRSLLRATVACAPRWCPTLNQDNTPSPAMLYDRAGSNPCTQLCSDVSVVAGICHSKTKQRVIRVTTPTLRWQRLLFRSFVSTTTTTTAATYLISFKMSCHLSRLCLPVYDIFLIATISFVRRHRA